MATVAALLEKKLTRAINGLAPVVGAAAESFFKNSFARQAWLGPTMETWLPRKPVPGKKQPSHQLLQKTRTLYRGIRYEVSDPLSVVMLNSVPYAKVHNDGFKGMAHVQQHVRRKYASYKKNYTTASGKTRKKTLTGRVGGSMVRAHGRRVNIPRRRFMGDSPYLRQYVAREAKFFLIKNF